jgi:hypothetical protein
VRYFIGLDLGQRRDYTAIAVVERLERPRPYGETEFEALLVRHAERLPLGTRYPAVVDRVRELTYLPELMGRCELIVDATGVGTPIVDLLRAERLGSSLAAVTITSGGRERMGAEGAGQHDDLVMALALACWKGRRRTQTIRFSSAPLF